MARSSTAPARLITLACLTSFALSGLAAPLPAGAAPTALDRYVAEPDAHYQWRIVNRFEGEGYATFVVDLTSQAWLTAADVDRPEWRHWLVVVRPEAPRGTTGMLIIGGGSNRGEPPARPDATAVAFARQTQTVVAELRMVPNQPLVFVGTDPEKKPRSEDDLIAYCWARFLESGEERWLPRLPMVKSAVRAMDTIQALLRSPEGGQTPLERFVVAGGSKRGWTTWLTAAVDPRVVAIVPIVIDVLNVEPSMRHHFDAYGFWAPAIGDYVRHGLMDQLGRPEMTWLLENVDPYVYRDRFSLPKYLVNATGDEFFLPDSSQFYFDDLPGEKYLRYVPNAKHSLDGSDARQSILAFYQTVLDGRPRPRPAWTFEADGAVRVQSDPTPSTVLLWQATNPEARDFRLDSIGPAFTSSLIEPDGSGVFVGRVPQPEKGWTAYFVEMSYETGGPYPLKLTTPVRVTPDTLPFEFRFHRDTLRIR